MALSTKRSTRLAARRSRPRYREPDSGGDDEDGDVVSGPATVAAATATRGEREENDGGNSDFSDRVRGEEESEEDCAQSSSSSTTTTASESAPMTRSSARRGRGSLHPRQPRTKRPGRGKGKARARARPRREQQQPARGHPDKVTPPHDEGGSDHAEDDHENGAVGSGGGVSGEGNSPPLPGGLRRRPRLSPPPSPESSAADAIEQRKRPRLRGENGEGACSGAESPVMGGRGRRRRQQRGGRGGAPPPRPWKEPRDGGQRWSDPCSRRGEEDDRARGGEGLPATCPEGAWPPRGAQESPGGSRNSRAEGPNRPAFAPPGGEAAALEEDRARPMQPQGPQDATASVARPEERFDRMGKKLASEDGGAPLLSAQVDGGGGATTLEKVDGGCTEMATGRGEARGSAIMGENVQRNDDDAPRRDVSAPHDSYSTLAEKQAQSLEDGCVPPQREVRSTLSAKKFDDENKTKPGTDLEKDALMLTTTVDPDKQGDGDHLKAIRMTGHSAIAMEQAIVMKDNGIPVDYGGELRSADHSSRPQASLESQRYPLGTQGQTPIPVGGRGMDFLKVREKSKKTSPNGPNGTGDRSMDIGEELVSSSREAPSMASAKMTLAEVATASPKYGTGGDAVVNEGDSFLHWTGPRARGEGGEVPLNAEVSPVIRAMASPRNCAWGDNDISQSTAAGVINVAAEGVNTMAGTTPLVSSALLESGAAGPSPSPLANNVASGGDPRKARPPTLQLGLEGDPQSRKGSPGNESPSNFAAHTVPVLAPGSRPRGRQTLPTYSLANAGQLRAALFLEASRVHRCCGPERLFAKYWEVLGGYISSGGSSCGRGAAVWRRRSDVGAGCETLFLGVESALRGFLTTRRMRRLHNMLVFGELRAVKRLELYFFLFAGKSIPIPVYHRLKLMMMMLALMAESMKTTIASSCLMHAPRQWICAKIRPKKATDRHGRKEELGPDQESELSHWNEHLGSQSGAWTSHGPQVSFTRLAHAQFAQVPELTGSVVQRGRLLMCRTRSGRAKDDMDYEDDMFPSARLPGTLDVDPVVRRACAAAGLTASDDAVWLLVVAIRQYAAAIIKKTISDDGDFYEGHAPMVPNHFGTNLVCHSLLQAKAEDGDVLVKEGGSRCGGIGSKVIDSVALSQVLAADPSSACDRLAWMRAIAMSSSDGGRGGLPRCAGLDEVNCIVNTSVERAAGRRLKASRELQNDGVLARTSSSTSDTLSAVTMASAPLANCSSIIPKSHASGRRSMPKPTSRRRRKAQSQQQQPQAIPPSIMAMPQRHLAHPSMMALPHQSQMVASLMPQPHAQIINTLQQCAPPQSHLVQNMQQQPQQLRAPQSQLITAALPQSQEQSVPSSLPHQAIQQQLISATMINHSHYQPMTNVTGHYQQPRQQQQQQHQHQQQHPYEQQHQQQQQHVPIPNLEPLTKPGFPCLSAPAGTPNPLPSPKASSPLLPKMPKRGSKNLAAMRGPTVPATEETRAQTSNGSMPKDGPAARRQVDGAGEEGAVEAKEKEEKTKAAPALPDTPPVTAPRPRGRGFGVKNLARMRARASFSGGNN